MGNEDGTMRQLDCLLTIVTIAARFIHVRERAVNNYTIVCCQLYKPEASITSDHAAESSFC